MNTTRIITALLKHIDIPSNYTIYNHINYIIISSPSVVIRLEIFNTDLQFLRLTYDCDHNYFDLKLDLADPELVDKLQHQISNCTQLCQSKAWPH